MDYIAIAPCIELKEFVSHFWIGKLSPEEQVSFTYHATAGSNTEIAFAFAPAADHHHVLAFSSVQGPATGFNQFSINATAGILGVSLYSHTTPIFLDTSPSYLINQFVDLDILLGNKGDILNEKMSSAPTPQSCVDVLSDYFKSQLSKKHFEDQRILNAIKQIRKQCGNITVNQLASGCCLSAKQFERRFTAYSGFKPKLFSRIIRFESALWQSKHYENLTELAHTFGYYDQSHFIRDFKAFTGVVPRKFIN